MLSDIAAIYRQSKKKNDNFWTEWVSRPPAAVLVWMLKGSPITPNQASFFAIAVAFAGAGVLCGWRTHLGLIVAGLILQLAYIIDCVDGQLARVKNQATPVGALLDFLLDEIKAFVVLACAAARLWLIEDSVMPLLIGMAGLVAASSGITLTSFVRRKEYLEYIGAPPLQPATERGGHAPRSFHPVALVEALGRYVLHYPSWFLYVCAFNRLDIFLYAYVGAHVLYLGRTGLVVLIKLGKPWSERNKAESA